MEKWKSVVGYEDIYEVSDQGRVCRIKAASGTQIGRILRPVKDKKGYYHVNLCKEGISHACKIHRLVLMAFIGKPKPGQEGNHKNGNKADNRLEKLEWVTKSENDLHRCRVLGKGRGELHGRAKLINKDIHIIRKLLVEGKLSLRELGRQFNVSSSTIYGIKHRQTWTHAEKLSGV